MRCCTFLLIASVAATAGADELTSFEKNAAEFNYKGITVNSTFDECQTALGEPTHVDHFADAAVWTEPTGEHRAINILVEGGRVHHIQAIIYAEGVEQAGVAAIQEKLIAKYGRPTGDSEGNYVWRFEKVGTYIAYVHNETTGAIGIVFQSLANTNPR